MSEIKHSTTQAEMSQDWSGHLHQLRAYSVQLAQEKPEAAVLTQEDVANVETNYAEEDRHWFMQLIPYLMERQRVSIAVKTVQKRLEVCKERQDSEKRKETWDRLLSELAATTRQLEAMFQPLAGYQRSFDLSPHTFQCKGGSIAWNVTEFNCTDHKGSGVFKIKPLVDNV